MTQVMSRHVLYTTACSHNYKKPNKKQLTPPQKLKLGATSTKGANPGRVVTL